MPAFTLAYKNRDSKKSDSTTTRVAGADFSNVKSGGSSTHPKRGSAKQLADRKSQTKQLGNL